MVWPPIRFANSTTKLDPPTPFPSPPTWTLTEAQCRAAIVAHARGDAAKIPPGGGSCRDLEPEWLGTDAHGHDVVARLIYGFRISVLFGLILAGVSSVIGIAAGAVQGYFGGWLDLTMQRLIEIWSSLPHLYILIILSAILAPGFFVLLTILLLFSWVSLVHLVRAEFLRARNFEYVNAARALGLSNAKIIVKHVLPNAMVATLTFLPFIVNSSISTLTSLDFLGLGMPPGSPSLGELLLQGKSNLSAPWLGAVGLLRRRADAVAADLHRRSGARRLRSAKDLHMSAARRCSTCATCRSPSATAARRMSSSTACRSRSSAARRWRWSANPARASRSPRSRSCKLLPYPAASHPVGRDPVQGPRRPDDDRAELRAMRGAGMTMVFQEPMTSLNPLHTIERQIGEIIALHGGRAASTARPRRSSC